MLEVVNSNTNRKKFGPRSILKERTPWPCRVDINDVSRERRTRWSYLTRKEGLSVADSMIRERGREVVMLACGQSQCLIQRLISTFTWKVNTIKVGKAEPSGFATVISSRLINPTCCLIKICPATLSFREGFSQAHSAAYLRYLKGLVTRILCWGHQSAHPGKS